jgi:N-formylmaleamate deformylase
MWPGDVVANGIRIHYHRTGGDKPPIVLSHGFGDDGLCWTRLAQALGAEYDVVMPDARGHGRSEAPETGYNATTRAEDLASFIEALGLDRPFLGGHSMGATTTLYCAALRPDVVRAGFLEDPGFRPPPSSDEAAVRLERARADIDRYARLSRDELIDEKRQGSPTWDDLEFGPWADAKQRLNPRILARFEREDAPTWSEALAMARCPMLLVTAEPERGALVTREAAAEARRIKPDLQVARFADIGHDIRREAFEPFLATVRAFLTGVPVTATDAASDDAVRRGR